MNKNDRITHFEQSILSLKKNSKTSIIIEPLIQEPPNSTQNDDYQLKDKILKHLKNRKPTDIEYDRYNRFYTKPITMKANQQYVKKSCEKDSYRKYNYSQGKSSSKDSLGTPDSILNGRKMLSQEVRKRFLSNQVQNTNKNSRKKVKLEWEQQRQFSNRRELLEYITQTINIMNTEKNQLYLLYFAKLFDKVIYVLQKLKSVLEGTHSLKINHNQVCDAYLKTLQKQYRIQEVWNIGSYYIKRIDRTINHTLLNSLKANIYNEDNDNMLSLICYLKNIEKAIKKIIKNKGEWGKDNNRYLHRQYNP